MPKNKIPFGVFGVILVILGAIGTIPLAIKGTPYVYGILLTIAMVIAGVLLVAWAFSD